MTARQAIELVTNHPGKTSTELARIAKVNINTFASQLHHLEKEKRVRRLLEPDMLEMRNLPRLVLKRFNGTRISKAWRYYPVGDQPALPINSLTHDS